MTACGWSLTSEFGFGEQMTTWVQAWTGRRRSSLRPILLGELLVVFLLLHIYDYVKSLESVRMSASLHNGLDVLSAERWLHIDVESVSNHWLTSHETVMTLFVWWYQYSHISGTMAVLTCCYLWFPQMYRAARNSLLLTNCVGMLVFVLVPVMPPRLLPGAGYIDSVAVAGYGHNHGGPVEPAQFAAMPSLHLAWATWVALVAFAMLRSKPRRGLVFLYPTLTAISVVTTANHYVLDVAAGVSLALTTCVVSGFQRYVRLPALAVEAAPAPVAVLES